jgi:DNA-binding MarR family transcriptional regulator
MIEKSSAHPSLEELGDELQLRGRELSMAQVAFQSAVAERLGLSGSDMRCVDFIHRFGPLTAGELGEVTRLTSGAITGVLDRLERMGFAHRVPAPSDRRKVLIEIDLEMVEREIFPLYQNLGIQYRQIIESYKPDEVTLLLDFMRKSVTLVQEETTRIWGMSGERR